MSNIEEQNLEFWQNKKADYEECLEQELSMENLDDVLIGLLREHIEECIREIDVRN